MKENSRDARLLIRLVSILILVGLIITVFVSVVTTETDKNDTKNRMNTILSYVKKQCVRRDCLGGNYQSIVRSDRHRHRNKGRPKIRRELYARIFKRRGFKKKIDRVSRYRPNGLVENTVLQ